MRNLNDISPEDFKQWMEDSGKREPDELIEHEINEELLEYNGFGGIERWAMDSIGWSFRCVSCEEDTPLECTPEEFDPDMHYCGRSPRCCP